MSDRDKSISATRGVEGLWSNHRADPGGKTMYGITRRTYLRAIKLGIVIPNPQGVRGLSAKEADEIYRVMYWDVIHGDDLPTGLNALVFDIEVNSGQGGRRLQRALSVVYRGLGRPLTVDNQIGNATLSRVGMTLRKDPMNLYKIMEEVSTRRLLHWTGLRIWKTFKLGWARRGARILIHSVLMTKEKRS